MRYALAGIILLVVTSGTGLAQAEGSVESLGFNGVFRSNTWTPLKVALRPTGGRTEDVRLYVTQDDMDRDRVQYVQTFPLTGGEGGGVQRRWVYFVPQPSKLGDASMGMGRRDLEENLKVFVSRPDGGSPRRLDVSSLTAPRMIDSRLTSWTDRSTKLILVVRGPGSVPPLSVFATTGPGLRGVTEDLLFQPVGTEDLPDNVIGYDSVDAILWLNADPQRLSADVTDAIAAWVREGGRMVVCHSREVSTQFANSTLGAMLPVDVKAVDLVGADAGLATLRRLGGLDQQGMAAKPYLRRRDGVVIDPWAGLSGGQFPLARATLRPGGMVDEWDDEAHTTPYIARRGVGFGSLTWVAQDLGNKAFVVPHAESGQDFSIVGWAEIWDRIFDFKHRTVPMALAGDRLNPVLQRYPDSHGGIDVSGPIVRKMDLPTRGAALVGLSLLFFVIYWFVAALGSHMFLAQRKMGYLSWPAFAVCALGATAITMGVVRLALHGPPQLQHISFVRVNSDGEATVHSNFGLYIPQDGVRSLELKETAPDRESHIIPFPQHPDDYRADEMASPVDYQVPVPRVTHDAAAETRVNVPYRTTIKKFQAKWSGRLPMKIDGQVTIRPNTPGSRLVGKLTNKTGQNLHNVYFAYRNAAGSRNDWIVFLPNYTSDRARPAWAKDEVLDMDEVTTQYAGLAQQDRPVISQRFRRAAADTLWSDWWYAGIPPTADLTGRMDRAWVMLSLAGRIQPMAVMPGGFQERYELVRRYARQIDAASAVAAGQLVIIAQGGADEPLPFTLDVQGDPVTGSGEVYYQFVLPIDRVNEWPPPTTAPATTVPAVEAVK